MIAARNIYKNYDGRRVLENIDLELPRGGISALIGPNGAGKSTLLTIMSRLLKADSGAVWLDGLDIHRTPTAALAKRLAILRQDSGTDCRLTVAELVAFGRYPYSKGRLNAEDKIHIARALDYLELAPLSGRFLDELSGGQKQRAFIAMILCQNTDYILLDEPLNNLDMKHSVAMMRLLRRAADELGKTIIIVLHDINFASCYADRIIALRDGKIIAQGAPEQIMRSEILRAVYDIEIEVREINQRRIAVYYRD